MGVLDWFTDTDDPTRVQVSSTATSSPEGWVQEEAKNIYDTAVPIAGRGFPAYPSSERVEPFGADTEAAFQLVRDNTDSWRDSFMKGLAGLEAGAAPVGEADIARYMNPYTSNVIDSTVEQMNRQAQRDRINRNANLAQRGSYLNEDRREIINTVADDARMRAIGDVVAKLRAGAFADALAQANTEKSRGINVAGDFLSAGGKEQQLGLGDATALANIGTAQQQQGQQRRNIDYAEFLNAYQHPQEQLNYLMSVLTGVPYQTRTTTVQDQLIPQGNSAAATIGGIGTAVSAVPDIIDAISSIADWF